MALEECNFFNFHGLNASSGYGPPMKIILFLSLLSSSTYACPLLQGNYKNCVGAKDIEKLPGLSVAQNFTRGVTSYEFVQEDPYTGVEHREIVIADGEFRETSEGSDGSIQYKAAYRCENNELLYAQIVEQVQDGKTVRIEINGRIGKDGNRLTQQRDGTIVLDEEGRISVKSDPDFTVCE